MFARLFISFSINLKSPENPLSENFFKSPFCSENVFGNTLILAGVSMYMRISSFGAISSSLALIPPDFFCREEGEEIWPMIPECDDSKLWNKTCSLTLYCWSQYFIFSSEANITVLSDLLLHIFLSHIQKNEDLMHCRAPLLVCVIFFECLY